MFCSDRLGKVVVMQMLDRYVNGDAARLTLAQRLTVGFGCFCGGAERWEMGDAGDVYMGVRG